ncbi:MAG: FkbM family methyltransferase [Candidatus Thiodiazotropha sp.]|jgi:FkbM family methyltransferase
MITLEKFEIEERKKALVNNFVNSNAKKYIMGISRDGYAKGLSNIVDINGFIDDFTNSKFFLNKPIVKTADLEKDSLIVVCSTVRTRTAVQKLHEMGFINVISYPEFYKYIDNHQIKLRILSDFDKEYSQHSEKYDLIHSRLKDTLSKETFISLLNYRSTANLEYMKNFIFDPKGQYFEDFLKLQEEVFIDAGGFDGQTSIEFIKHCPNYKAVYIIEPSKESLEIIKNNLKNFKNINFISKGLSNKQDTLKFDMESGSASSISENGTVSIEVDTLDTLVEEKVTFIKVDIEGAEGLAIEGMKHHILKDHPKMAISVYHKVDDFWKIPEQIFSIRDDYDIYMRHYTEGTDETVMFFMPK